jgi:NDP-sugar pyrophosphorylase family protein
VQTLLLATGEKPKLRPLTDDLPPAMLPVGHQPVMAHMVELLAVQGFKRQVVCLHYRAEKIEAYFGTGQRWGVSLEYVIQRDALGTAGAVKWAARQLTETFVVLPADVIVELDLIELLSEHRHRGSLATRVVRRPGTKLISPGRNGSKPPASVEEGDCPDARPLGIYVFEPEVLDLIPPLTRYDIEAQLLPALRAAGQPVGAFEQHGYWNELATFQQYQAAQRDYLNRLETAGDAAERQTFPWRSSVRGRRVERGIWVGHNNAIHPSVRLAEPVLIGKNCRIGRGVELGPNAVLGANVVVDDEATVRDSLVLDNTYVGKLVKIENRLAAGNLLVDVATSDYVRVADTFWLGETPQTLSDSVGRRLRDLLVALVIGLLLLPAALVWGVILWLSQGQVLTGVALAPRYSSAGSEPAPPRRLWRFSSSERTAWAARLSRWQAGLEIDRWPELWSVITGDLALVGTKPVTAAEAAQTDGGAASDALAGRSQPACEPGFTGLWYVQTGREADRDEIRIADAYYAATWSWRSDWQILARTPAAWMRRVRQEGLR